MLLDHASVEVQLRPYILSFNSESKHDATCVYPFLIACLPCHMKTQRQHNRFNSNMQRSSTLKHKCLSSPCLLCSVKSTAQPCIPPNTQAQTHSHTSSTCTQRQVTRLSHLYLLVKLVLVIKVHKPHEAQDSAHPSDLSNLVGRGVAGAPCQV